MKIGYYAHHHGTGHGRQADKLMAQLRILGHTVSDLLTVFTSLPDDVYTFKHIDPENIIRLPDEHETSTDVLPGRAGNYWQPSSLHYSPVGNDKIRQRSQILLSEVQSRNIDLMIIDLSVEVALLCRTSSIPYLYVRLPGDRNDAPHLNAFQGAIGLIAPYPKVLESASAPEWVRNKTLYLGFLNNSQPEHHLSHASFTALLKSLASQSPESSKSKPVSSLDKLSEIVTVIKGFGGHEHVDSFLPKLREVLPDAYIISLGPITSEAESYVDLATKVDSVIPFVQHSDLIVMACGLNAVGEVCQYDTPLVVIPDERPHAEQQQMAESLVSSGRAIDFNTLCRIFYKSRLLNEHVNGDVNEATTRSSHTLSSHKCTVERLNITDTLHFHRPSSSFLKTISQSDSNEFIQSMVKAEGVKQWFYQWLLPQLSIQPERTN